MLQAAHTRLVILLPRDQPSRQRDLPRRAALAGAALRSCVPCSNVEQAVQTATCSHEHGSDAAPGAAGDMIARAAHRHCARPAAGSPDVPQALARRAFRGATCGRRAASPLALPSHPRPFHPALNSVCLACPWPRRTLSEPLCLASRRPSSRPHRRLCLLPRRTPAAQRARGLSTCAGLGA